MLEERHVEISYCGIWAWASKRCSRGAWGAWGCGVGIMGWLAGMACWMACWVDGLGAGGEGGCLLGGYWGLFMAIVY